MDVNIQRSTPNIQLRNRYGSKAIPSLSRPPSCGFINRSHNRADNYHLDEAADAPVNDQLPGNGWAREDAEPHADRRNLQQDPHPDSRHYAATSETARIDRHERENHKCLNDNDPVKQAHHFTLRPPKIWCLRVNIL